MSGRAQLDFTDPADFNAQLDSGSVGQWVDRVSRDMPGALEIRLIIEWDTTPSDRLRPLRRDVIGPSEQLE